VDSKVGEGTTFRIWLPMHERPPRLLGAQPPPAEAAIEPSPEA
jgi:hypothetical protein